MPDAEFDITPDLVTALLAEQHPDLAHLPVRIVAEGWDNVVVRLGEDLGVRLPRREVGARLLENEQTWLPRLADRLPVTVPAPVRVGVPGSGYPWPWSVVRWTSGTTAARTPVESRAAWAAHLGEVIGALHAPAPDDAPVNPFRRGRLADRDEVLRSRLDAIAGGVLPRDTVGGLRRIWAEAVAAPDHAGPALWIHGDPHPANLVVADGRLVALVDFGDLTSGDPAVDLSTASLAFDAPGRAAFLAAYGGVDDATWSRAQGWAVVMAVAVLAHEPVDRTNAAWARPAMLRLGES
ncbi:aminoglycoside phosphotransferase [Beutenbergia cavernae DSM 12333]|uniref:Aminoglycoside phosphotransferase n=1 Tax=Beutenbergia cavernae (strain ATCC BAA-8 / DSM 12333 / CCUG 43141 / JCM 11478 / NBRC 16432 / NCIMB 13614 / HKI 0122) TaxID=471853 RepID=C5C5L2_BEUC1|nr:aminoglycoside phosphotransferase family protein [Beutenbergia cavernae]ACQ80203.1 aminoglycoside phosphotransferase [Beutenbergia cavernae DSM 12333]